MRRLVALASVLVTLGATGCSGSSDSRALPPDRAGNPTDSSSPTGPSPSVTTTPPPSDDTSSSSPTSGSPSALDLPACLIGSWAAPVAREFDHLALAKRSDGTVRGATGVLALTFTSDQKWTLSYRQVKLDLTAGSVDVDGPMDGTWSLAGDKLTTTVGTSSVRSSMHLGGLTTGVPRPVSDLLAKLPPDQVFVTCTGTGLQFQLPSTQGGGTATFDRA